MRAIKQFRVKPVLPETLRPLDDLAKNLRWSWHDRTRELFRAVDPIVWDEVAHDPLKLLARVSPQRLRALAEDQKFVRTLSVLTDDLEHYLTSPRWFQRHADRFEQAPRQIAYFSAEFGVSEVLPVYSGGLGILAGDHLKAASDLGVPLIGVGLLYRHGYFRQYFDASGWQQERYPTLENVDLPIRRLTEGDEPVTVTVPIRGRTLTAEIWIAQVGRVPLLLMDADVPANDADLRLITDRLYGGGAQHRLDQEVLLGIGGVRAVREYCRIAGVETPDVYHCNEGHAGFLGLERIREYLEQGHDFDTAVELTRAGNVFTTHTPVPAGIDRFDRQMVADQFADFGLPLDRVLAFGAEDYPGGDPHRYNMAVMGLRLGQRSNGVSELHGYVSREMFHGLWPDFTEDEVPIGAVTNGVHHRTWVHPELLELLESPTDDNHQVVDGVDWFAAQRVDANTLWSLKRQMRGDLVTMARERLAASCQKRGISDDWVVDALDPNVLTLGFARRGASYKRLTLMLKDTERLKRLLLDPERPIQIVIAGKAHPADDIGKSLIQTMVQFADSEDVRHRIVVLPDYDISLARPLYPGCDVWVNNPLRPYEACGTSGMKAALNGAANLSIRDGWWDELYAPEFGWEIPSAEDISDPDARDRAEAAALYDIIEHQIVPRFYNVDSNGLPLEWIQMMRDNISDLGPKILASRMVRDYVTHLYAPAAHSLSALDGKAADLAAWKGHIRAHWNDVRVERVSLLAGDQEIADSGQISEDDPLHVECDVHLGSLTPADVAVELVFGDVDDEGELGNLRVVDVTDAVELGDNRYRFHSDATAERTGSRGFTVRVVPKHELLSSVAEMGLATLPH